MTCYLSNLFSSGSSILSKQIGEFQAAEAILSEYSKQFGDSKGLQIEAFDTHIPTSSIPIKDTKCMMYPNNKYEETYTIHAVRASNSNNTSKSTRPPLVLMHGYCNSALYFYRNMNGLRKHFQTVYSLDMFGWGLSSRPKFKTTERTVESAEEVYVESLEAWRKANNISKMILGGHSMGGYFAVAYCEKYPENVERLILISPVGVPHLVGEHNISSTSFRARLLFGTVKSLWRNNWTPGSVLRSLMSETRGRNFIRWYVDRRLPAITNEDEKKVLCEYMYTNNILPGSGDHALNQVLKPIAFARKPIVYRIPNLKVKNISFIYGEKDWMDPSGAIEVQTSCEKSGDGAPNVEIRTVSNAGHLLFLENWEEFNAAMIVSDNGRIPKGSNTPKLFDAFSYQPTSRLGPR